jgi:ankyrin repeat protein
MFELLLARGADATAALPSAAWQKDVAFAEIALRFGAKPDETRADGKPLLNQLIQWGQVRAALWLVEHGASPNIPDPSGWTAMHQAASRGNERVLKALIDAGGDLSRLDTWGLSPRDVGRAGGRAKILALVLGPARAKPAAAAFTPRPFDELRVAPSNVEGREPQDGR